MNIINNGKLVNISVGNSNRVRLMRPLKEHITELDRLCEFITIRENMVEIGCFNGESTMVWAKYFNTVYAIDPWSHGYDPSDCASNAGEIHDAEINFDKYTKDIKNIKKYKMPGDEGSNFFEKEFLDFVYIDACHQYEAVKNDIRVWLPKIKKTGWIGGHDYDNPEVKKAVDEEFGGVDHVFKENSWIIKIK